MSGFWISSSSGTIIEANNITLTKETTSFISTDNGNFQVYHNNFVNIEVNTGGAFLFIISYPSKPLIARLHGITVTPQAAITGATMPVGTLMQLRLVVQEYAILHT